MDHAGPQSFAPANLLPDVQSQHVDLRVQTTEHPNEGFKLEGDATNTVRDFSSRGYISYFLGSWPRLPHPY
jgi:hypothetical protein